ncbi:MAG: SIMPL domain-containing protein [Bryobacteraceae bacterium]
MLLRYLSYRIHQPAACARTLKPDNGASAWRGHCIREARSGRIDIGVVSQAQTAQAAGTQNAKQVSAVIAEIKKALGASAEIQTVNYSLQPNYKYAKDGSAPAITGYSANNTVQVKSSDLATVGKVIDASTLAGANTIHGIQFTLKDEQKVRAEALRQATTQALANATALAQAVQKRIDRIVRIEDGDPNPAVRLRAWR